MPDSTKFWERAGIPNADGFSQLLFNDSTGRVVAAMSRIIQGHPFGILYARGRDDDKYSVLADESDDGISFNFPVLASGGPYLFVLSMKVVEREGQYIGYDNIGIRKLDLSNAEAVLTMSDSDLVPEPPYDRIWASTIVGHKSEDTLFCSVGMQRTDDNSRPVDYYLCEVDVANHTVERVSKLHEVFI